MVQFLIMISCGHQLLSGLHGPGLTRCTAFATARLVLLKESPSIALICFAIASDAYQYVASCLMHSRCAAGFQLLDNLLTLASLHVSRNWLVEEACTYCLKQVIAVLMYLMYSVYMSRTSSGGTGTGYPAQGTAFRARSCLKRQQLYVLAHLLSEYKLRGICCAIEEIQVSTRDRSSIIEPAEASHCAPPVLRHVYTPLQLSHREWFQDCCLLCC